jgi:hypothetical protein
MAATQYHNLDCVEQGSVMLLMRPAGAHSVVSHLPLQAAMHGGHGGA